MKTRLDPVKFGDGAFAIGGDKKLYEHLLEHLAVLVNVLVDDGINKFNKLFQP